MHRRDIWASITEKIKSQIPQAEFRTWFSQADLKELTRDLAVIEVPNKFFAGWIHDRYSALIHHCFLNTLDFLPKIRFSYGNAPPQPRISENEAFAQCNRFQAYPLNPSWTFDNFITSSGNRFARSAAWEVANRPGLHYNPCLLYTSPSPRDRS